MAEEPIYTLTKKYDSAANQRSNKFTKATATVSTRYSKRMGLFGHFLGGVGALLGAVLTTYGADFTKLMENQAQNLFFQLRRPIIPPQDIVIVAIDDPSISVSQEYYRTNPQKYAYLEPMQAWPFKREAYARVVEKLMQAGARSVGVDVVFDTPSSYGTEDDRRFQEVLQRYGNKVTLAALYETFNTHQGNFTKLTLPQQMFRDASVSVGSVNFPLEINGKIHRLAGEFPKLLAANENFASTETIPDFDQAVLRAAGVNYPVPQGDRIYYYGSAGSFETIPFWYILDPESWKNYLQQGKIFQDKIVLIGATAQLGNDFHSVPISSSFLHSEKMSGVEIHAHAIATLMTGKSITQVIKSPVMGGLFVLVLVGGCLFLIAKRKRGVNRFFSSVILAITWGGVSYGLFVYGQLILPTAIPMVAIVAIGTSYLGTEVAREMFRKRQLIDILKKNPSSRVAQEIISQQDDLKELLEQRENEIAGKILDGRYQIVKVLGSGGFSETYIAEDTKLPGKPRCVVKQLKPANHKSEQLAVARRLFNSEAQTLQKLGTYEQIPRLWAYFEEEEEFYLVQEYIIGHPLNQELPSGKRLPETVVIAMLRDILKTLTFVHHNDVIHRDIKPSNIMRRKSDGKLILIDFGAVKEVTTKLLDSQEESAFTIGIGTKGYAPSEQCLGRPQYGSDIYAVGMIGIKALTGKAPHDLERDSRGQLEWIDKAIVSDALAEILNKMVHEDFQKRYQSASQVLAALDKITGVPNQQSIPIDESINSPVSQEEDNPTTPWLGVYEDTHDYASSTLILPEADWNLQSKD
ncbi:MAG: serine/threonine-protein kinase [Nostocaceae cyanobacterium]|nr:serine/threonine-protein kinase [Nostocaceae cyanobacterium]